MEDSKEKTSAGGTGFLTGLTELDRILRGELTRVSSLRRGGLEISPRRLSLIIVILAMSYGICMGTFALFRANGPGRDLRLMSSVKDQSEIPTEGKDVIIVAAVNNVLHFRMLDGNGKVVVDTDEKRLTEHARQIEDLRTQLVGLWPPHELNGSEKGRLSTAVASIVGHTHGPSALQVVASMIKVPLLFYLTLLVTLPSLYVFNSLVGSRLRLGVVVRLLVASLGVMVAVLASLGPIVAFFSVSTASYPFILLFNVAVFAVAGVLGLAFLLQTLHRLSVLDSQPPAVTAVETSEAAEPASALDPLENRVLSQHVKTVFRLWVIVFALVGMQMGWVLRPFIGSPNMPFTWLRGRESNFFQAVLRTVASLFS